MISQFFVVAFKKSYRWIAISFALVVILGVSWAISFSVPEVEAPPASEKRFFVKDGGLFSVDELMGAKRVIADKDIEMIFDEKGDILLIGKEKSGFIPDTDKVWGIKLFTIKKGDYEVQQVGNDLVQYAFLNSAATKAYYVTLEQSLFEVDLKTNYKRLVREKISDPNLSPDEKYFAYKKLNDDWQMGDYFEKALGLAVLNVETGEEKIVASNEGAFNPIWTLDSSKILFAAPNKWGLISQFIVDVDGTGNKQLTNFDHGSVTAKTISYITRNSEWDKTGNLLVFEGDKDIWLAAFSPGYSEMVSVKKIGVGENPKWTENGKAISVIAPGASNPSKALIMIDMEGKLLE